MCQTKVWDQVLQGLLKKNVFYCRKKKKQSENKKASFFCLFVYSMFKGEEGKEAIFHT